MPDANYTILLVDCNPRTGEALGPPRDVFRWIKPMTLKEAQTILTKLMNRPKVRYLITEVD